MLNTTAFPKTTWKGAFINDLNKNKFIQVVLLPLKSLKHEFKFHKLVPQKEICNKSKSRDWRILSFPILSHSPGVVNRLLLLGSHLPPGKLTGKAGSDIPGLRYDLVPPLEPHVSTAKLLQHLSSWVLFSDLVLRHLLNWDGQWNAKFFYEHVLTSWWIVRNILLSRFVQARGVSCVSSCLRSVESILLLWNSVSFVIMYLA